MRSLRHANIKIKYIIHIQICLDAVASIIGTLTKELEVKLEPLDVGTTRTVNSTQNEEELITPADIDVKGEIPNVEFEVDIDDMELEGCVVNPNDDTLDDEEAEEVKSEGDPVSNMIQNAKFIVGFKCCIVAVVCSESCS